MCLLFISKKINGMLWGKMVFYFRGYLVSQSNLVKTGIVIEPKPN